MSLRKRSSVHNPVWTATTLAAMALLSLAGSAAAHGDLHEQIDILSRQIEQQPRSADLYLRRGDLHRAHREFDAALADYERATELDPKLWAVQLSRGRMFFEAGWPLSAKIALDRYLGQFPDHVDARVYRARVLAQLGDGLAAARDYTRALAKSTTPQPDVYLERAKALMAEGAAHYDEALRGIEEGLKRLGPLVTLQLYAVDLEVKQKRFDAALERLEGIAAQSKRRETWLARRGEILRDAGRTEAARAAWREALEEINKLPPSRRNVPAMEELEKRVRAALDSIPPTSGSNEIPAKPAVK